MLKTSLTLVAGLLGLAMTAPAAVRHFETAPGGITGIQILSQSPSLLELECTVASLALEEVAIDGKTWHRPLIEQGAANLVEGEPDLPSLALSFLSGGAGASRVELTVLESRTFSHTPIAPSRGNLTRDLSPETAPYTFGEPYRAGQPWPAQVLEVGQPFILRDFQGQSLVIRPFAYDTAGQSLELYSRLRVRLELDPAPNGPPAGSLLDQDFLTLYKERFVNSGALSYTYLPAIGSMVVVCPDEWLEDIQPFVDAKIRGGRATTVVPVSVTGNTYDSIKNWLTARYQADPFSFVVLVGDFAQVPARIMTSGSSSWVADNQYGLLAGGDNYPEAIVGRFSAETVAQLEIMINRSVSYEENPPAAGDWYTRAVGVASAETGGSGGGDDGESDAEHMDNLRTTLLAGGFETVARVYDTEDGTTSGLMAEFNLGASVANYAGHGTYSRWQSPVAGGSMAPGWTINRINGLTNTTGWPVIMSVACDNGKFMENTCFAEAWLRANQNGAPTGAVAIYAASTLVGWNPPMEIQDEFNHLLGNGTTNTYGALCINGGLSMMEQYAFPGPSQLSMFQIFGDPSLRVRTQQPRELAVIHETTYSPQDNAFSVMVEGEQGARVSLTIDNELASSGITDEDGRAILNLPATGAPVDLLLVVSADNAMPYQAVIPQNRPPLLEVPIGTRMELEDTPVLLTELGANFSDADGDTVTVVGAEAVANGFQFQYTGSDLTILPPPQWNGNTGVTVFFTDGHYIVEADFELQIAAVNDAPMQILPFEDLATQEDTPLQIPSPLGHYTDADGDALQLLAATSAHGSLIWNGSTLMFTPETDYNGTTSVVLTISDGDTSLVAPAFQIQVAAINDAPFANGSLNLLTVSEDEVLALGDLRAAFDDVDGDELTLVSATVSIGSLVHEGSVSSFLPPADWNGVAELTLQVTDGQYTADSGTIFLPVLPVPDAPRLLAELPNRVMDEDSSLVIDDLLEYFVDVDGDSLYISAATADTGLLERTGNSLLLTPPADFNGPIQLGITISDGALVLEESFSVLVLPVGDQLVLLEPFGPLSWNEDESTGLSGILAHFYSTDSDTLFIVSAQAGEGFLVESFSDSLALSAAPDWNGTGTLVLTVDDGMDHPLAVEIPLTVQAVNDAPWLDFCNSTSEPVSDPAAFLDSLGVRLADVDGDELVLEWYFQDALVANQVYTASADTSDCLVVPEELYALTGEGLLYLQVTDGSVVLNEGGSLVAWQFVTSGLEDLALPTELVLGANYPNPFNPSTLLPVDLPRATRVSLSVYNIQGQRVRVLHEGTLPAGHHTLQWDAAGQASGLYLAVLEAEGTRQVRRMSLVR